MVYVTSYLDPGLSDAQVRAVNAYRAIRRNPESWDQSTWRQASDEPTQCGAKLCFYGHIAQQAGAIWLGPPDSSHGYLVLAEEGDDTSESNNYTVSNPNYDIKFTVKGVPVKRRVARLLGLVSESYADRALYDAYNEITDLRNKIIEYLGVDPETGYKVRREIKKYNADTRKYERSYSTDPEDCGVTGCTVCN